MNAREAIEALKALEDEYGDDPEVLHSKADEILMECVPTSVSKAYEELFERNGAWYA